MFTVIAINLVGSGPASTQTLIVAGNVPPQPSAPVMSFRNSTAVAFNYTAPVNTGPAITGYKIQWNSGSGSVFTTITT